MLRLQRAAVHLVGEQDLGAGRLGEREAAGIALFLIALYAAVGCPEHDLNRARIQPNVLKQATKRRPGPFRGADRFAEPWEADRAGSQPAAPVAGALERDRERATGAGANLLQGELERPANLAASGQSPAGGVDGRDVPVRDEVVKPRRRQIVPHCLERHPAVAERELDLLAQERSLRRLEGVGCSRDRSRRLRRHAASLSAECSAVSDLGSLPQEHSFLPGRCRPHEAAAQGPAARFRPA